MRILLIFLIALNCSAQNLIPNPSFELSPSTESGAFSPFQDYRFNINSCLPIIDSMTPYDWEPVFQTPDRIKQYQMNCFYDYINAQDGIYYLVEGVAEAVQCSLTTPLVSGMLYELKYYYRLETLRGASGNNARFRITFYPSGTIITSPIINASMWTLYVTNFTATGSDVAMQIQSIVPDAGFNLDNISLSAINPLPVLWLDIWQDENTILWSTAAEINCLSFLLCYLIDDETWEVVESVPGHGNSSMTNYYSADIERSGFYKIGQVDYDGNITWSKILRLKLATVNFYYYDLLRGQLHDQWRPGLFRK
jgi:hypothetical protein